MIVVTASATGDDWCWTPVDLDEIPYVEKSEDGFYYSHVPLGRLLTRLVLDGHDETVVTKGKGNDIPEEYNVKWTVEIYNSYRES